METRPCRNTGLKDTAVTPETEQSEPEAPGQVEGRPGRRHRRLGVERQDVFTAGQGARRGCPLQGNRPQKSDEGTGGACGKGHIVYTLGLQCSRIYYTT